MNLIEFKRPFYTALRTEFPNRDIRGSGLAQTWLDGALPAPPRCAKRLGLATLRGAVGRGTWDVTWGPRSGPFKHF